MLHTVWHKGLLKYLSGEKQAIYRVCDCIYNHYVYNYMDMCSIMGHAE